MAIVIYKGKNVYQVLRNYGDPILLLPGANEISEADLKTIQDHPTARKKIANGKIVFNQGSLTDGKKPVSEMLQYISQLYDTKILRTIMRTDGRGEVVEKARVQLENIKNGTAKEADGDLDGGPSHFN